MKGWWVIYKVKTSTYAEILKTCWENKTPLYVYGGPGIGKSEIPKQVFKKIAAEKKLEFKDWNDLSLADRMECIKNAAKYFVFCDQRISQMDTTDLRGIPNMINTEMLETVPMSWVIYFTQPQAHGAIFFDELNLAAPAVAGQAYQIINDRCVADRRLSEDTFVFGAGNRLTDQAHVFEMPFPLRDRFCEFEIFPDVESWTRDYAVPAAINPHLVAFVNWKESYLYHVDKCAANKSSTPRGIARASKLIGERDITTNEVFELVSISVGEGFAAQFQAYCKHFQQLDWNQLYSKPEVVKGYEVDKLWAIVGGLTEQFIKGIEQKRFDQQMALIMNMRADFAIVTLKMYKEGAAAKKFALQIKKSPYFKPIVESYSQYLVD